MMLFMAVAFRSGTTVLLASQEGNGAAVRASAGQAVNAAVDAPAGAFGRSVTLASSEQDERR